MATQIAFGIDLAGYNGGKSVCAAASAVGDQVDVKILLNCPLSKKIETSDELASHVRSEAIFLRCLLENGPVAVDVPIDLQRLPDEIDAIYVWQLTLRPVDRYLGALPPLADKIGAPTARFRNILRADDFRSRLGTDLFETYPAGSLKNLGLPHNGYKGTGRAEKLEASKAKREEIAARLHIEPMTLTDDELDATICAVTALAGPHARLEGAQLSQCLSDKFPKLSVCAPEGYVLLQSNPYSRIAVSRMSASDWLEGRRVA